MDKLNYDIWRELFETHCLSFGVSSHLDGTSSPSSDTDTKWKERDGLVKMWIYGTISESLLDFVLKKKCSARELWLYVEALFRDNKDGRALQLENDLRTLVIGDLNIHDFCQKLKSISDLLANIDSPVSDKALVMHMVNGLSEKFDNIVNVIIHKTPFPSFSEARSMLLMEESRLQKQHRASSTSTLDVSSPNVLLTSASYSNPSPPSPHNHQQHHHNNSGRGRGGSGRGGRNNRGRGRGCHHSSWEHNYQPPPPSWFHPSMSYPSWTPPAWPPSPYSYGTPPSYGAS
ncbi:PREDICTED: uncharacterized protein LOC104779092 [Camelina sativa]|uniref:Uncharacterized protein LOC104779092 n=1 Tax=Camelina sativa TaxID=90675 RepID=A0ABM0YJ76_CAMSA|nr:PREDICTED: uncharacterized protein LOC104779092 [Camelina sativa]